MSKIFNILFYILLIVTFFFLLSCFGYKPRAKGVQNEILVFVSDEDKEGIIPILDSVFNRICYTPQPESVFEIRYLSPEEFQDRKSNYNIIVAAILEIRDNTGDKLIQDLLPASQFEMVTKGENQIFTKMNLYSRGQIFAIFAGISREELETSAIQKKDVIYDHFDQAFLERENKHIFQRMEQKKLSEELGEKNGWRMRIQHDYIIIREDSLNNFLWIGRAFPYRWISVHWIEQTSNLFLNRDLALKLNKEYPQQFYGAISFTDHFLTIEETFFNHWSAWRIQGLWEHKKKTMGGPFISYIFYDGVTDRIYHINLLIYNPGNPKVILLRQMDIIAQTFTICEN